MTAEKPDKAKRGRTVGQIVKHGTVYKLAD